MKKILKCEFGYIKHKRTYEFIKALIGLAIIVIIFMTGILIYGSKNNTFTVIASVCALPFAKIVANLVMFIPYQPTTIELYNKVEQHNTKFIANYDCIFTSKEHVMPVQAVITTYNAICAYTTSQKIDLQYFEKTLKDFMKHGKHTVTVNLYKDENQFLKRIDYLNSTEDNKFTREIESTNEHKEKMGWVNESMKVMCL